MPTDDELNVLADHIDQTLEHGTATRKALIEALVDEIQAPGQIRPVYRIPRHIESEPATEDGTTVRTMGNLVGDTGIEPVTPAV
ncbi:MAG: hypothetical protein ACR2IK_20470 [Chloroflexota bacterium]